VTAKVELRRLAEPIVLRGKVAPGVSVPVVAPVGNVGDTAVITKISVAVGDKVREGAVLFDVAGKPVFPMLLPFPLYRDIAGGDAGPDVAAVQKALTRLGFTSKADGVFGTSSQEALRRLYQTRGYQVPLAAAKPTEPQRSTGEAKPSSGTETPAPSAGVPTLLRSAVVPMDRDGRRVTEVAIRVGAILSDPHAALLRLDGEPPSIITAVSREQTALLRPGTAAEISDDVAGTHVKAEVLDVSTQPAQDEGGMTGFEVRLRFVGEPLRATDRTFRITVIDAQSATEVMAVPVTAIYSRADGSTVVTVPRADATLDVPVQVGRTAGGWSQITPRDGSALAVGTSVVVGTERGKGSG
jgi:peptidoglycan hydrolase-like protein with peptidoglycan-binding domain